MLIKFEVCIVYDGFICFFQQLSLESGQAQLDTQLDSTFLIPVFLPFSIFLILLGFKKTLLFKTVGSEFDNSEVFAILHAIYRVNLTTCFVNSLLSSPASLVIAKDNPFVICLIFSGLSETCYNHAKSPEILISFNKLLRVRQYHIDDSYNSKFSQVLLYCCCYIDFAGKSV